MPNGSRTTHKRFANQTRVCVDGTANLRCTNHERFAYRSPQTEICRFFCTNTKRTGCARCPFHALGVLCSLQVREKLINRAPLTRHTRTAQHARVYKALLGKFSYNVPAKSKASLHNLKVPTQYFLLVPTKLKLQLNISC